MKRLWAWLWRKAGKRVSYGHDFGTGVRAVFLGDFVSGQVIRHGYYERRELETLARSVFANSASKSTALDIGANIGNHAAFLSNHFDRVIAFEPNPMVACLLKANAMALGGGGGAFEVVETGLSDSSATLNFSVNERNLGGSSVVEEATGSTIDVTSLDSLAEPLGIRNVSFVKIDVEGHEARVLGGGRKLFSESRPVIAMEAHYENDPDPPALALLHEFGYRHYYRFTERPTVWGKYLGRPPKPFRRYLPLLLEETQDIALTNHNLLIASRDPIESCN